MNHVSTLELGGRVKVGTATESDLTECEERLKFSIVTPSLNQAAFLPDALASVSNQGVGPYEHIVVDGCSTDGTLELLENEATSLRSYVGRDNGQSDALNKGLSRARGRIIGWLNADDFYLAGAFQAVEDYFLAHPDVDVVYGDTVLVDKAARVLRGKRDHRFDQMTLLYHGCFIATTATFFRSELLGIGALRLDTDLEQVMDTELFLRLGAAGFKFGHLPRELAAFRWHDSNKSYDVATKDCEKRLVQRRYGAAGKSDATLSMLGLIFRLKHVALKLQSGAYVQEAQWKRRKGEPMRWWASPPTVADAANGVESSRGG